MISKNGVRREALSVALTVQRYNREIALYEFSGNFFRGKKKFFSTRCTVAALQFLKRLILS